MAGRLLQYMEGRSKPLWGVFREKIVNFVIESSIKICSVAPLHDVSKKYQYITCKHKLE